MFDAHATTRKYVYRLWPGGPASYKMLWIFYDSKIAIERSKLPWFIIKCVKRNKKLPIQMTVEQWYISMKNKWWDHIYEK